MKPRICDAAAEVLRETKNEAVMWSDDGLLADIAARAGVSATPRKASSTAKRRYSRRSPKHQEA